MKNEDLSAFCFYFSPNKNTNPFFWDLVLLSFSFLFSPPSTGCLQTADAESVHMGIKRPTTLSISSHTFRWSHQIFSFQHISVSFKTFSLREKKDQSVLLFNNNNKKNYYPLSRKKGKKVSLRISVKWPAEAAGVSAKVRDENTFWRRAWELQQHPLTEVPWAHSNIRCPSPGFDCQPC